MDALKTHMQEKIESFGFSCSSDNKWIKEDKIEQAGAQIIINGQKYQQKGETHDIKKEFSIMYETEILTPETGKTDKCIMCGFKIHDNDNIVQDMEINIYPGEFDFFEDLCKKLFNL